MKIKYGAVFSYVVDLGFLGNANKFVFAETKEEADQKITAFVKEFNSMGGEIHDFYYDGVVTNNNGVTFDLVVY